MDTRATILRLHDVTAGYGRTDVLHQINLNIGASEFCALTGPNGCGKSTLLKCLIGFLPIRSGSLDLDDTPIQEWKPKQLARHIALIPQETSYQFDFTVEDIVLMGQFPYLRFGSDYNEAQRSRAETAMRDFGVLDLRRHMISQLSGGEKQRVHLARAWAQDTPIILMDESLANLDLNYQIETMHRLVELNRKHQRLILAVSHNINLISEYCDRIVLMRDGEIIGDGTPDEIVTEEIFDELYHTELIRIQHPRSGRPHLLYPGNHS